MKDAKTRLIVENNAIYEVDLECMKKKEERKKRKKNGKKMKKMRGLSR